MKTQHTPGPWTVSRDGKILGPHSGCSNPIVAQLPVWWSNPPGEHASQDLQYANAALIAASPDLLAACEQVLDYLERHVSIVDAYQPNKILRQAINKALIV